jgi:glucosamine--fructose-6-phosphate aminotransferase (isomerizing)
MSLSSSEAFHFAEFRHGPMSMVDDQTLVVGLMSDSAAEFEVNVLQQMKELGARLLAFSDNEPLMASIGADYPVCLCSGISEYVRGALYLPVLQLVAYYRAIQKGLDPDRPKHLTYAVKL